ncbi:MAG: DnaJ domain-containing protein [Thermoplasmata archaeon]
MPEDFKDYYAILNVPLDADQELISEAYRKLTSFTHPDKQPENRRKLAEERQKDLNEAYNVLKYPVARKEYDEYYKSYQEFLYQVFKDGTEKE